MGEYLQYEFRKEGEKVIHRFDDTDALYVIIDGTVDIIVDLKETPMWGKELADLAKDLELDKSNLIKKIQKYKDDIGLDQTNIIMQEISTEIGSKILKFF